MKKFNIFIFFLVLLFSSQLSYADNWSSWSAIPDNHKNGIDFSWQAIPNADGKHFYWKWNNRYRDSIRIKYKLEYVQYEKKEQFEQELILKPGINEDRDISLTATELKSVRVGIIELISNPQENQVSSNNSEAEERRSQRARRLAEEAEVYQRKKDQQAEEEYRNQIEREERIHAARNSNSGFDAVLSGIQKGLDNLQNDQIQAALVESQRNFAKIEEDIRRKEHLEAMQRKEENERRAREAREERERQQAELARIAQENVRLEEEKRQARERSRAEQELADAKRRAEESERSARVEKERRAAEQLERERVARAERERQAEQERENKLKAQEAQEKAAKVRLEWVQPQQQPPEQCDGRDWVEGSPLSKSRTVFFRNNCRRTKMIVHVKYYNCQNTFPIFEGLTEGGWVVEPGQTTNFSVITAGDKDKDFSYSYFTRWDFVR